MFFYIAVNHVSSRYGEHLMTNNDRDDDDDGDDRDDCIRYATSSYKGQKSLLSTIVQYPWNPDAMDNTLDMWSHTNGTVL